MNDIQLPVLPATSRVLALFHTFKTLDEPDTLEEAQDVRLLLFVEFPNVLVGAHLAARIK